MSNQNQVTLERATLTTSDGMATQQKGWAVTFVHDNSRFGFYSTKKAALEEIKFCGLRVVHILVAVNPAIRHLPGMVPTCEKGWAVTFVHDGHRLGDMYPTRDDAMQAVTSHGLRVVN